MEATASPLRQQLDNRLDQLTPAQQQHILQILEELTATSAKAGRWWEYLTRTITEEDAELMRQASLECRTIEPDTTPTW